MKIPARVASVACAFVAVIALTAARQGDVKEYDGSEITSEDGIVVMNVIWDRSEKGGMSKTITRGDDQLSAVFKQASGGKKKIVVTDIDKVRAFVLPAGRWYLAEIRTPTERNLAEIATSLQSFEVIGGNINYAGVYTIDFTLDSDGRQRSNTQVAYDTGPIETAAAAWPDVFGKKTLVYCPVAKRCKPPSEFKF